MYLHCKLPATAAICPSPLVCRLSSWTLVTALKLSDCLNDPTNGFDLLLPLNAALTVVLTVAPTFALTVPLIVATD